MKTSSLAALALLLALLLFPKSLSAGEPQPFIVGADLSLLKTIEDHGVQFREDGMAQDPLSIFKDHGFNYVRLRLFVNPDGTNCQFNSLAYTVALARQVKAAGFHFLLDIHYSDGWADPGHQITPAQWKGLNHAQLVDQVFSYTRDTMTTFRQAGCLPDMIEVGNEITDGMLWPDGGPLSEAKWDHFADLLKAGIRGIRAVDSAGSVKVLIHIDRGDRLGVSKWFFAHLIARKVPFDIIGLSYYPFWNGRMAGLRKNLDFLARTYNKDIIIAETDFAWRKDGAKAYEYPTTPDGQKAFLQALLHTVEATPNGHGRGIIYWAPEWIEAQKWQGPSWSYSWESRALFDASGNALPGLGAFQEGKTAP
jgi:arabinogalactan endo-1,4-beta-galactosidase